MTSTRNRFFIFGFLMLLFAVMIFGPQITASEVAYYEYRSLQPFPEFSWTALLNNTYFPQLEAALSDHFILRESLMRSYTRLQLFLHKPVVNDIVITDEVLLPYNDTAKDESYDDAVTDVAVMQTEWAKMKAITDSYGGKILFTGIASQATYFADKYPWYLDNHLDFTRRNAALLFDAMQKIGIDVLDLTKKFPSDGTYPLYHKTDHHYTLYGAFSVYRQIIDRINQTTNLAIEPLLEQDLSWEELPNRLMGTRYRALFGLSNLQDPLIYVSLPETPAYTRLEMWAPDDTPLIDRPATQEEDAFYTIYMGGDHPETILLTDRPELPNLLIIGDSYTNALEPLFYAHFNQTRSLDLRHYNWHSVYDYVAAYQPDVILFIRDDTVFISREGNGTLQ